MTRKAFGIADNDGTDVFSKGGFQGIGFRTGGTAARGRIGLVGDEHQLLGYIGAV